MKTLRFFLLLSLFGTIESIKSSDTFSDRLLDTAANATLFCTNAACNVPRYSLGILFCPGQALMAAKLWNVNPTTCKIKMDDFKKVQLERFCMLGGASCAFGAGSLACSVCGCPAAAEMALLGSEICLTGACLHPQIPFDFRFESPTGYSKDS